MIHGASHQFHEELHALAVYEDGSALHVILFDNEVHSAVNLDPNEDGSDIAICGETKEWFDRELAAGRAKTKDGAL
jgi:hypothetical protein